MTTAKNDVLLGYTLVGGGVGGGGGIDFCWGDKNLVRGRESTGGIFPDQWEISPFLAGGGRALPTLL